MASVVQICNMALSHIGADARVASISPPDGSAEAGHCATFYGQARTEMLEPGDWNFSLARAPLAQVVNTSPKWIFAYSLPSDYMRARRVLARGQLTSLTTFGDTVATLTTNDNATAEFEIEGEVLYTNEPDAILLYVRDVTDPGRFTPSFISALSYLLASYLAGPIIKGSEGTRTGDAMRQRAMTLASMSATAAANASNTAHNFTPSSVQART